MLSFKHSVKPAKLFECTKFIKIIFNLLKNINKIVTENITDLTAMTQSVYNRYVSVQPGYFIVSWTKPMYRKNVTFNVVLLSVMA